MDGTIANLPAICELADRYDALVMVDDSHAVGFLGPGGRGTPEYHGVTGRIDILTGTLGKALGGGSGGYRVPVRGQGLEVRHILRLKTLAVLGVQRLVVGQRTFGQFVDGQIRHHDADLVFARIQRAADVHLVRRAPYRAGSLAVDIDDRGFAHRAFQHGAHAGAGIALRRRDRRAFSEIEIDRLFGRGQGAGTVTVVS